MNTVKLSLETWFLRWTEFCIDWFMNFFADPDYYWVEETYPNKRSRNKKEIVKEQVNEDEVVKNELFVERLITKATKRMVKFISSSSRDFYELINQLLLNTLLKIKQIDITNNYIWSKQCLNTIKIE